MSTTTMDAKTAILARARDAISRSQQGRPVRTIPRDYIRSTEHAPGSQAVIDEMIEKLEDYSAKVVVVSKESEVADAISTFLADQKATSVVVPTGLDEAFKRPLPATVARSVRIAVSRPSRRWSWMRSTRSSRAAALLSLSPAPSFSTESPTRVDARSRSCPTPTSSSSRPPTSSPRSPRRWTSSVRIRPVP